MRRVTELDSIRGIAALAIVFYHLWFVNITLLGTAVDLFFVLSGFLITTIILDNHTKEGFLITFYVRRSLRIWPIYYLSLFLLVACNRFLPAPARLDGLGYYLTYTQKLPHYWSGLEPPFIPAFRHTWTLAIEEQFYLLWPLLVCLLGRRRLVPLTLALVVAAVAARYEGMNPWLLVTHCDGLALGGLLALTLTDRRQVARATRSWGLVFGSVVIIALSFPVWGSRLFSAFGAIVPFATLNALFPTLKVFFINLGYFGIVGMTVVFAGQPVLCWLRDRQLAYLGQISYGLYLYHHIVFFLWDDFAISKGFRGGPWIDIVKLISVLALAVLSWEHVERPILGLKDRFDYRERLERVPGPQTDGGTVRHAQPQHCRRRAFNKT